jgi:hypothetical protein
MVSYPHATKHAEDSNKCLFDPAPPIAAPTLAFYGLCDAFQVGSQLGFCAVLLLLVYFFVRSRQTKPSLTSMCQCCWCIPLPPPRAGQAAAQGLQRGRQRAAASSQDTRWRLQPSLHLLIKLPLEFAPTTCAKAHVSAARPHLEQTTSCPGRGGGPCRVCGTCVSVCDSKDQLTIEI